ncbi:lamin tail domain-containing protein [Endozoicomonas sp. SM1973]|uniref:Lamin tail domain-containing protein n=1 Tax=Spartinivicinus marinus TaxID=2994442 RepID=A0A853I339_9GAMM|nr:lamin tail domain-containing protein [Spartinivicinus marinus]
MIEKYQIIISDIKYEGALCHKHEEYLEIKNIGPLRTNLSGWHVNAGAEGQDYLFPEQTYLAPGQVIRVYIPITTYK